VETDAIRLSFRDVHSSHCRRVAESCARCLAVPALLQLAAPRYPARDLGH
jgi:hypothetical protein